MQKHVLNGKKLRRICAGLILAAVVFSPAAWGKDQPEIDTFSCPDKGLKPLGKDYKRGAAVVDQYGLLALPFGLLIAVDDVIRSDALAKLPKVTARFTVAGPDGAPVQDAQIAVLRVDENRFLAQIPADGKPVSLPEGEYLFTTIARDKSSPPKVLWGGGSQTLVAKKPVSIALKTTHEISSEKPGGLQGEIPAGKSVTLTLFNGELPQADLVFLQNSKIYSEQRVDHWPITLAMPTTPGDYQLQVTPCAPITGVVKWPIKIAPANIKLSAPDKVLSGAQFNVSWSGDGSEGDVIGLRKSGSSAEIANPLAVRTVKKAQFTAPLLPGSYDLIYQSAKGETSRSGATLALRSLQVAAGPIQVIAPAKLNSGEYGEITWPHGPGNASELSLWSGPGGNATKIVAFAGPGLVRPLVPPGEYQLRLIENGVVIAANALTIAPSKIFAPPLTSLKPGATLIFPKEQVVGFFDRIGLYPAGSTFDDSEMLVSGVGVNDHIELVLPDTPGQFELALIARDDPTRSVVLGHAPVTISGLEDGATKAAVQMPAALDPLEEVPISWVQPQLNVLEIWSSDGGKPQHLKRLLTHPGSYRLALMSGDYYLRMRLRRSFDRAGTLDPDVENAGDPAPPLQEIVGQFSIKPRKIMVDVPAALAPNTKFTVKIDGSPKFFDEVAIVPAGVKSPLKHVLNSTRARDIQLEAPANPGKYELVYFAAFKGVDANAEMERIPIVVKK